MHFYEAMEKIQPKEEVKVEQTQPINNVSHQDIDDLKKAFSEQLKAEIEKSRNEMLEFLRQNNVNTDTNNNDDGNKKEEVVDINANNNKED